MTFLISIAVKLLEWILLMGGKALYEWTVRTVEDHKLKQKEKENLTKYKEAKAKGNPDDELDAEKNLINS